jgi:hypothetical protein
MVNDNEKLHLASTLVRINDIISSAIDSETILLHLENSKYYGMDAVGSRIWEILEKPIKLEAIINMLIEEYEVSKEQCEQDVYAYLAQLLEEGLIQIINA